MHYITEIFGGMMHMSMQNTLSDDLDYLIRYVLPLPVSISPQNQVLATANLTL